MTHEPRDSLTSRGADDLARRILDFWHRRGYRSVRIEKRRVAGTERMWELRSNLVNGKPAQ